MQFEYDNSGNGAFQINQFDPTHRRWRLGTFSRDRTGTTAWHRVVVPVTPTAVPYAQLGVHADGSDLRIRDFRIFKPTKPVVAGTATTTSGADHTFPADSIDGRILVPVAPGRTGLLTFEYRSSVAERLDVNIFDPVRRAWRYGVLSRAVERDARWRRLTIPVEGDATGFAQIGVFVAAGNLDVRSLELETPPDEPTISPAGVAVRVLNGNGVTGAARRTALALAALGFRIAGAEDADRDDYPRTQIRYRHGGLTQAELLQSYLVGPAELVEDPTLTVDVVLLIGRDFDAVHEPSTTGTSRDE